MSIREKLYPADEYPHGHPDLSNSVNNLARLHQARGDYGKALPLYERALAMREALYPAERYPRGHTGLAQSLNNLALLHQARGDYGKALPLYERALAINEAVYSKNRYPRRHPDLATSVNNLALLHQHRGDYAKALPLLERALAMNEVLYPKIGYPHGHPALAQSINNLAELHQAMGDYGRALPLLERALAMKEGFYPPQRYPHGHPDLAQSINNLAGLHQDRGDYGKALPLFERALAMKEALYPKDRYPNGHPHLALSFINLAAIHDRRGEYAKALPLHERALAMFEGFATADAETSSEAEALNLFASLPLARDAFLSLPADRVAADAAYAPVWRGKAVLSRLLERRHRDALAARDPTTRELFGRLQDTRRLLARLLLAPADPARDSATEVAQQTADKERLERELARALPAAARRDPGTPADLAGRLPADTAFVDLLQFTRSEQEPSKPGRAGETRTVIYVAFVLAPGGPVRRVDLGPAGPIDEAVAAWRKALLGGSGSPAAAELRRLVWEPVARQLPAETRTVYVAPDGALTRVPWAALPGREQGSVLLEDYALAVVPSGPSLLERLRPSDKAQATSGTLVTLGGVPYDAETTTVRVAAYRGIDPNRSAERGPGAKWGPLPATGREAARVGELAAPRTVVTLVDKGASVSRLATELPGARWAHLATHGFFADPAFRSAFQLDERLYERTTTDRATPGARSPLVLSGLVLAGANKPDPDGDGGILTAEAIVGLDLSKMDLAVLSACETGLGEVAGGEGVYGLQRAFHQAGCRDVVASLWRVNDEATAALMAVFYRKLWREDLPPLEALRQAQLTLYRHPERIKDLAERGWDVSKTEKLPAAPAPAPGGEPGKAKAPAKLWAAFVLSGPGRDYP